MNTDVFPDPNPCRVLGVLDDGAASLSATARAHLRAADRVIGGARTLALLEAEIRPDAERLDLTGRLSAVPGWVSEAREAGRKVVVLATGDPLCHGIAGFLAARLCVQAVEVLPNVSTLQLACARVGLVWQDAKIVSIHAKDAGEWQVGAPPAHGLHALAQALRAHDRLLVLTSPENTPARIARLLLAEGQGDDFRMAVAERLLQPDERVRAELAPAEVAEAPPQAFADPNVVLLWRVRPRPNPVRFGLADRDYHQRQPDKGLITKQEVRAVSLARLQLRADSVVWDLGAGSGSVGLEAARLCPQGHVWAIEKNEADVAIARTNRDAFAVSNHTLVHGRAPEGLEAWPDPDAVFIGGSGGELSSLIALCLRRLRPGGHLVMNFVTLENLAVATQALKAMVATDAIDWDVLQLQAARSRPILDMHRMAAENPVWIVCARKEAA
ncbi:precorrin-6y C5,15-methyltransferase (decarboxylating) subunit CbiE [Sphaerotilus uruguayifluvii]|uniref:Precorrin-6Y C5,15-methyltransferase (Decarboxylating) n=1 Tax=Sphaerotilus uruguayifluvii TaxID=2735897 RepID=A0ABX2FY07_9BURK|nr:precorrin-6y C5,15-methyltransferase (decarboxylating) subunit CbiE [Leptothrix sp. C29]NRT54901.1 precorrin-6Y C5,15-methyltransferase (decarboxylating) [Leptothrix sp. C29]